MNYLALGGLRHYSTRLGPNQERCALIYNQLRKNLLDTILSEYKRSNMFWEQYDESTGKGTRGHPFTGWTALVLNIMAEIY